MCFSNSAITSLSVFWVDLPLPADLREVLFLALIILLLLYRSDYNIILHYFKENFPLAVLAFHEIGIVTVS